MMATKTKTTTHKTYNAQGQTLQQTMTLTTPNETAEPLAPGSLDSHPDRVTVLPDTCGGESVESESLLGGRPLESKSK